MASFACRLTDCVGVSYEHHKNLVGLRTSESLNKSLLDFLVNCAQNG